MKPDAADRIRRVQLRAEVGAALAPLAGEFVQREFFGRVEREMMEQMLKLDLADDAGRLGCVQYVNVLRDLNAFIRNIAGGTDRAEEELEKLTRQV